MNDIQTYLDQKKLVYKTSVGSNGQEAILAHCPLCQDNKFHMYVNLTTGTYHCKKCDAGGGFLSLKKELGDVAPVTTFADLTQKEQQVELDLTEECEAAHERLLSSKKGMWWCNDRGWTRDAIIKLKLGMSNEEGRDWIWYPFWKSGKAVNIKKRSMEGEKNFKRITGGPSTLYNVDTTLSRQEFIIVCEGEADVVAMVSHSFYNTVGTTTGAKGVSNEWVQQLDKFPKIIFAYDNDDDGREGAYKFASRLGIERCYKLNIPTNVKDVNQFFMEGGDTDTMQRMIDNAKKFDVQHVSSLGEEIKKGILKQSFKVEEEKLHLPWNKLDYLTDGLVAGDLIVLAAKPGVGKTTFALNILYHMSMNDVPVLLFEMEMRPERIMPRVVAMHMKMDSKQVMNSDMLPSAYQDLAKVPFYFAYLYKKPTFDQCADTIRACVRTYGIKFVVFDNLHFLCRSTTDQTREVSVVVQSFKLLAEELGIPILAIARPRKNTGKVISNVDLKDSADIEGDADIIVLLHRENKQEANVDYVNTQGIFDERMRTIVSKCRYSPGGEVLLTMDDKTARVLEP